MLVRFVEKKEKKNKKKTIRIVHLGGAFFTSSSGVSMTNVGRYNSTGWSALGSGLTGPGAPQVYTLLTLGGFLYAGGDFTTSGAISCRYICKWNLLTDGWSNLRKFCREKERK